MKNTARSKGKSFYIIAAVALLAAGSIARLTVNDAKQKETPEKNESSVYSVISSAPSFQSRITSKAEDSSLSSSSVTSKTESKKRDSSSASEKATAAKPVTFAMPIKANIIKQFSDDRLVYSKTYGDMRVHNGIDIVAKTGTLVKASGEGKVSQITDDRITGKTVVIDHGSGIKTYYCGLNDVSVKNGEKVTSLKVIGTVGEVPSECLDESHLHFAVSKGDKWVSPLEAMGLE